MLAAGRTSEGLDLVRRPARPGLRVMRHEDLADGTAGFDSAERERVRLEIRILQAMGDRDAAQALRWRSFETSLDNEMLRDYLAHLPDFEEFEALDRAFAHASAFPHRYAALSFLLSWPRLDLAAKLVLEHPDAWDGRHYGVLAPAAEVLEDTEPRAASVLLYRALIDDILQRARSPAYGHAARYLARLEALVGTGEALPPELPSHEVSRAAESLVESRIVSFLQDEAALFRSFEDGVSDVRERHVVVRQAASLGKGWAEMEPSARRIILQRLVARVDVRREAVAITLRPGAISAIMNADRDPASPQPSDDEPTLMLTIPARLKRTGMEIRLVVEGADREKRREPDRSMLRLLAMAHRFQSMVMHEQGRSITELAGEAGVSPSYFTRVFRLSFLSPAIVRTILQGRHPREFTAKQMLSHMSLAPNWTMQATQLGVA